MAFVPKFPSPDRRQRQFDGTLIARQDAHPRLKAGIMRTGEATLPSAEQVATALAYEFLKKGNYSTASGPVEVPRFLRVAAVADVLEDEDEFQIIPEFAGLSVQSVGFEDGVDDPKVHIYLTRGSSRMIKELPEEVEGVPLSAHKMGPINVRPDSAAIATNRGNFYEKNARVCCGSSCALTSENLSGTLGALVRQHGSRQIFSPLE